MQKVAISPTLFITFLVLLISTISLPIGLLAQEKGNGMNFIRNEGQVVDANQNLRSDILYSGSGKGAYVYLRKGGFSYVLQQEEGIDPLLYDKLRQKGIKMPEIEKARLEMEEKALIRGHRIDVNFLDGDLQAKTEEDKKVDGHYNFYYAHCSQGITGVGSFNKVTYKDVYPNIDVVFYGGIKDGLKYDIVIKPGGNPSDIKLEYIGADELTVNEQGELIVANSIRELTEDLPKVYQQVNGEVIDVEASYKLDGSVVLIEVEKFNKDADLVIDPWVTYYGGPGASDLARSLSGSDDEHMAVAGRATYNAFPVSAGAFQLAYGGNNDAYVLAFDPFGIRKWATYYGGTSSDIGTGVCHTPTQVILVGETSSGNFPATSGALSGGGDAFIVKLDPATGARTWAMFFGGAGVDGAAEVDVDPAGNILLTGNTTSNNFPTSGAIYAALSGGNDFFISKLSTAGALIWSTYYGGANGVDKATDIKTDPLGNVAICGYTTSTSFPVSGTAYQTVSNGLNDAVVIKLTAAGAFMWATYLGGAEDEFAMSVSTDSGGNVIVSGQTWQVFSGAAFPTTAGAYRTVYGGSGYGFDIFTSKFSSANGAVVFSTYVGYAMDIEGCYSGVDADDNIFVFWEPEDDDPFKVYGCEAYQPTMGDGLEDQIISKFDPNGNHICDTFLGGGTEDDMDGSDQSAFDVHGYFWYASAVGGRLFPVTPGAFQTVPNVNAFNNSNDMYIAKICSKLCGAEFNESFSWSPATPCKSNAVSFNVASNNNCDTSFTTYQWTFTGASISSSTDKIPQGVTWSTPGTYQIKFKSITPCKIDSITQSITISDDPTPTISSLDNISCNGGNDGSIQISTSGGTPTYTYSWNTSQTTANISNLSVGSYTLNVTDNNGCVGTTTATITQPSLITNTVATVACSSCSLNGQVYSSTGVYTQTLSSFQGCDSILTLTLTINSAINTSGSASVCQGQPINIHGVSRTLAGVYTQTFLSVSGCDSISTITLAVNAPSSSTLTTTACENYTYNSQNYFNSGVYSHTLTGISGCDSIVSLNLTINKNVYKQDTLESCGEDVLVHGATQNLPGLYSQTFSASSGCDSVSNVLLNVNSPPSIGASQDTTILYGDTINLVAVGGASYLWSTGETTAMILVGPTTSTSYLLQVIGANGCVSYDTILVTVNAENLCRIGVNIFVPNSFSPNGDGQNDYLNLYSPGYVEGIYFAIYNRWGEKIFETPNTSNNWDGTYRGRPVDSGVYVYVLKVPCETDATEFVKKGNISLLR